MNGKIKKVFSWTTLQCLVIALIIIALFLVCVMTTVLIYKHFGWEM